MSFSVIDTNKKPELFFYQAPECTIDIPVQIANQVSGVPFLDLNLGIPYFSNEIFGELNPRPSYMNKNGYYNFIGTQNATSEYLLAGWEPTNLQTVIEEFLIHEGHNEIINYSNTHKFFSQGNTQSIGSILYFAKKYVASLGKTLSVKSIGPTYYNFNDTCDILGIAFNMYNSVADINNLSKNVNDFWLFYSNSPNNPDGRIFNTVTDIPSNVDAIYYDGAYSYKHYIGNQRSFPVIDDIFSQRPNVQWINYGFSLSKAGLPAYRLSYNILCHRGTIVDFSNIDNYINNTTLGFGIGLLNSTECFIGYVNSIFMQYTDLMKNKIADNRQKIINAITHYFTTKYPGNLLTISPTVSNVPYVWFSVNGIDVAGDLATMGISVKNGTVFFVSPMNGNNNYCRISVMASTLVINEFVSRLQI